MRMSGLNDFFSRFSRFRIGAQDVQRLPGMGTASLAPGRSGRDTLDLSAVGERLRFQGEVIASWGQGVTKSGDDPVLVLMDKSLSRVGSILEQMKAITIQAESPNLTDLDRVNLQIDLRRLEKELGAARKRMSLELAGESPEKINVLLEPAVSESSEEGLTNPDLLQRMRYRAEHGERWNVAEVAQSVLKVKEVRIGDRVIPVENGWENFELPADVEPGSLVALIGDTGWMEYVAADDRELPTARQRLEAMTHLIVMDAKSAAESTRRLDDELESLGVMREELAAFAAESRKQNSANQDAAVPSDAEVDAMAGQIEREAESRRRAIELNAQLERGEISAERFQEKSRELAEEYKDLNSRKTTIRTRLGVMEVGEGGVPSLTRPSSPMGALFSRMESLFRKMERNLRGGEETVGGDKVSWAAAEYAGSDGKIRTRLA